MLFSLQPPWQKWQPGRCCIVPFNTSCSHCTEQKHLSSSQKPAQVCKKINNLGPVSCLWAKHRGPFRCPEIAAMQEQHRVHAWKELRCCFHELAGLSAEGTKLCYVHTPSRFFWVLSPVNQRVWIRDIFISSISWALFPCKLQAWSRRTFGHMLKTHEQPNDFKLLHSSLSPWDLACFSYSQAKETANH